MLVTAPVSPERLKPLTNPVASSRLCLPPCPAVSGQYTGHYGHRRPASAFVSGREARATSSRGPRAHTVKIKTHSNHCQKVYSNSFMPVSRYPATLSTINYPARPAENTCPLRDAARDRPTNQRHQSSSLRWDFYPSSIGSISAREALRPPAPYLYRVWGLTYLHHQTLKPCMPRLQLFVRDLSTDEIESKWSHFSLPFFN
jgi:hypothetical protein